MPTALSGTQEKPVREMYESKEYDAKSIAATFEVSRKAIYRPLEWRESLLEQMGVSCPPPPALH